MNYWLNEREAERTFPEGMTIAKYFSGELIGFRVGGPSARPNARTIWTHRKCLEFDEMADAIVDELVREYREAD